MLKPFRATDLDATLKVALHQNSLARQLFAEQDWLRTLLASISDGVIAAHAEGRVLYLNNLAAQLTGWPRADALGQLVEQVFRVMDEEREPGEHCQLGRVLQTGELSERLPFILKRRNGDEILSNTLPLQSTATGGK